MAWARVWNRPPATSGKRRIPRSHPRRVNGFIGNHLTERLLNEENYEVWRMDIGSNAISRFLSTLAFIRCGGRYPHPPEWIEYRRDVTAAGSDCYPD